MPEPGQLISCFSLTYAVATPMLAITTGRFRRYQLLVAFSLVAGAFVRITLRLSRA